METQLYESHLRVERKQIAFALKENPQGTFLRITEEVSGRRNAIIIPATGLEQFRDLLNEIIKFNQTTGWEWNSPRIGATVCRDTNS